MSKAWGGRNLIGLSCLLAFTAAAAFAEPVREAPAASSIAIVSSPARGDTYELGEAIEVAVEFDGAVTTTGRPQVALTIGTHTRHATVSRLDGQSLYFVYTVHEEDRDEDGVGIAANALILNGGTITADDGTADADLTHAAVAAGGGSKVNGSMFSPPAMKSISFHSSPAKEDTYELGETIAVIVQFDRVVTATGEAQVALTIGTETRHATAFGWGSHPSLYFSYTVQDGDRDEDGISIPANALSLDRGTIKGPDGTTDADLTHAAVAAEGNSKVNGSMFSPPAVTRISWVSSPARGDTYERGETIELIVQFDRMVTATGGAQMALTIGTETPHATASGWGSSLGLFFDYTVQEGDRDEDGISIAANSLALAGGTVKGPDGTTDADLTHVAVAADGGRKVDGSLFSPPAVKRIYFASLARDDTYELGETVEVLVEFDKAVRVTGSPQVALTIGSETRHAAYSNSWADERHAHFSYTVQEGDRDEDGVSIPPNALSLNGGTIQATDRLTDADLTHAAVAPELDRKVDGTSDVAPPRVRDIYFASSPARGDTYQLGETIEVEVEFDGAVKTIREPRLALTIGTRTLHATGFGWGSHSLSFQYTVQAGDRDEDGISIPANALSLNGGTITAPDGTTDAVLTHEAMAPDGASKVNGSDVTPPRVRGIRFGYSPPARGDTYELGETVEVEVEFDRAVTATGEPQVALTIGTETRHAAFAGWGRQTLYFDYTVQEGDRDEDGISIPASALALDGGTIKAADGTTDADLTHGTVAAEGGRKMNGSLVTPPAVRQIYFSTSPARGDTYELGEVVEVVVDFDRTVRVTGSPQVALTIGSETRHALSDGWGSDSLYFQYAVQAGDRDEDGISIAANALVLNGGSITAADATTDADLTHPAVSPERDRKVDGSSDVPPPRVRHISFDSSPARGDTYELGEMVEVVVEFDGAVKKTGSPQVALTIGTETRHATWFGWGSQTLYFQYTVHAGDRDEDGISIPANALLLNSGTITAADGITEADLTHPAVADERGSKVDGSLVTPPVVIDVHFISSPARGDTYERGETVEVLVEFDKEVAVTGSPQVALTIGAETRHAISDGWGSSPALLFEYTVREGDRDEDGISIPANALSLNGGTITAADGTTDADLTHGAVAAERSGKVNGSRISPPGVRDIYFISAPANGDTYELGEAIEVLVEFGRAVTVTGSPQLALTIGTLTRQAPYSTSWDDRYALFSYAVQEADRDENGISIAANSLALSGGTITAVDGTTDADLTHDAVAADAALKVNGRLVTRPVVSAIYLDNHVPPPSGDTYVRGERVRVWVEFDRDVIVTGSPQVALTIGSQTRQAIYSGYSTFAVPGVVGTFVDEDVLSFDYMVQAIDRDEDGISIAANALALNGGTIKHAADRTSDADLTHDAVAADPGRKVNGGRATP